MPALILVQPGPDDLHVEFVRNIPPFDADVLVGRDRPELYAHESVTQLFPGRTLYIYDSQRRTLRRWMAP
jgi:hypothetical protein